LTPDLIATVTVQLLIGAFVWGRLSERVANLKERVKALEAIHPRVGAEHN
jgi:hypothetical protein